MPKIFGTNILGILAAAIAGYIVGYLWYGVIFMEKWEMLTGMGGDANMDPMMFVWGFLITLVQTVGLAAILNWAGASKLVTCIKIAAIVAILFIIPAHAADTLYQKESIQLLGIDASHALVSFIVMGAIISLFRGKDKIEIGKA